MTPTNRDTHFKQGTRYMAHHVSQTRFRAILRALVACDVLDRFAKLNSVGALRELQRAQRLHHRGLPRRYVRNHERLAVAPKRVFQHQSQLAVPVRNM